MSILYTQAQVNNAQTRAQVALYEISQNIQTNLNFIYDKGYGIYKALQYDIYTLYNVIGNELPFVTFSSTPTVYESQFYDLVGSLINKTKQFDIVGLFGGASNPNYQPTGNTSIVIVTTGSKVNSATIPFNNQTSVALSSYQSTYYALYGNTPYVQAFVKDASSNFEPDYGTAPVYTYVTPGNPSSGISSITWGYGVVTTGYILISGVAP